MFSRYYRYILDKLGFLASPSAFFLTFGIIFGCGFLVVVPPSQVPDEFAHFYKAYQISEGDFVQKNLEGSSGGNLPVSISTLQHDVGEAALANDSTKKYDYIGDTKRLLNIRTEPSHRMNYPYPSLATYSPVTYIPQSAGIAISRIFTDRILILFYAARLLNLACFIGLVYIAIRVATRLKWSLVVIGLLPMALFEAASLSADALTLGITILFSALLVRYYQQDHIKTRQWIILGIVATTMALCKQMYFLLIPAASILLFSSKGRGILVKQPELWHRLKGVALVGGAALTCFLAWILITRGVSHDVTIMQQGTSGGLINPHEQMTLILNHPLKFVEIYFNTFFTANSNGIILSFLGMFGWLNVPMPYWTMSLLTLILFLSLGMKDREEPTFKLKTFPTLLIASTAILCLTGICTALFVMWTRTDSPTIAGFQGRYFIPILAILTPAMVGRYSHNIKSKYILLASLIVLAVSLASIFTRYC